MEAQLYIDYGIFHYMYFLLSSSDFKDFSHAVTLGITIDNIKWVCHMLPNSRKL